MSLEESNIFGCVNVVMNAFDLLNVHSGAWLMIRECIHYPIASGGPFYTIFQSDQNQNINELHYPFMSVHHIHVFGRHHLQPLKRKPQLQVTFCWNMQRLLAYSKWICICHLIKQSPIFVLGFMKIKAKHADNRRNYETV